MLTLDAKTPSRDVEAWLLAIDGKNLRWGAGPVPGLLETACRLHRLALDFGPVELDVAHGRLAFRAADSDAFVRLLRATQRALGPGAHYQGGRDADFEDATVRVWWG